MYPFESSRTDFRRYFLQLSLIRDKAAEHSRPAYHIPFWSVIQASPRRDHPNAPDHSTPTFNQIRWQAYMSVAYGAKGIFYWTLLPFGRIGPAPGYGASFL